MQRIERSHPLDLMRTELSDYIENSIRTLIHTIQHTNAQIYNTDDSDIAAPNGITVRLVLNTVLTSKSIDR